MRKSFLRFAFVITSVAFLAISVSSCKSGPKDADVEKAINDKIASLGADATGLTASVKDGVATISGAFKDDATKSAFDAALTALGAKSVVDNATITPPPPPPVVESVTMVGDSLLSKGVMDATKDFPGVKAEVKDSVITLTGEIKKASLPKLMMTLHTLKAKKIDSQQLTTK